MNNAENIREITPQDLMALGVSDLAYVKQVEIDNARARLAEHGVFLAH